MIVPAAVGAGVGYLKANKKDRARGAVKGALWGMGIALVAALALTAAATNIDKDQIGFFKPQ